MKKVLVLLSIFLVIGFFYFWNNKNKGEKEKTSIIPDIHKGIAGVNQLKEIRDENSASGPLFYTTDGEPIIISKSEETFDYNQDNLKKMAQDCDVNLSDAYLQELLVKFVGTKKIVYSFKYEGGDESVYKVTLIPNKAKYKDFEQFKRDFNICVTGAEAYPKMFNDNWLLFVSSCGSGFSDNSNIVNGCEKAKNIIEPNLNFNY